MASDVPEDLMEMLRGLYEKGRTDGKREARTELEALRAQLNFAASTIQAQGALLAQIGRQGWPPEGPPGPSGQYGDH